MTASLQGSKESLRPRGFPRRMEACDVGPKWLKMRVFPTTADGALQVQQSPCQWSSPGLADTECGRNAGSPKSAVSPRPPRRDSGAARTAFFLGTRAVARFFFFRRALPVPRVLRAPLLSWVRWVEPRTCDPACGSCSVRRPARRGLHPLPLRRCEGQPGDCRRRRCSLPRVL